MLPINALTPCSLIDVDGLGLLQLLGRNRQDLLVFKTGETSPRGVVISSDHQFALVDSSKEPSVDGVLLNDIDFEVDPASAFDAKHLYSPYGALVRADDKLAIISRALDGYGMGFSEEVLLRDGLRALSNGLRVGFYSWRIVAGEAENRQVLHEITVEPAKGPPR